MVIGISQKLRRINSIKLNHTSFQCKCLRDFFCTERLKMNENVTLRDCYLCIFFTTVFGVFLSNRLNKVEFTPMKIISLMTVKKVKDEAICQLQHSDIVYEFNLY